MPIAQACRNAGVSCEIYPDKAKMKKQMAYANAKGIRYVVLAGDNEMAEQKVTLKNMESGEQQMIDIDAIIDAIKS